MNSKALCGIATKYSFYCVRSILLKIKDRGLFVRGGGGGGSAACFG